MTTREHSINDNQLEIEVTEFMESYAVSCKLSKKENKYHLETHRDRDGIVFSLFKNLELFTVLLVYTKEGQIHITYDKRIEQIHEMLNNFTSGKINTIPEQLLTPILEEEVFSSIQEFKDAIIKLDHLI